MRIGGPSDSCLGDPMVCELPDTPALGQTAVNSLLVEVGSHLLEMRSCGLLLWRPMCGEPGCVKLLAGSCEDLRPAF